MEIRELEIRRSSRRYLGKNLRADDRDRDDATDRFESLVSQVEEDYGVVGEARERYQIHVRG